MKINKALIILLSFVLSAACACDRSPKEVEDAIAKSPHLQRVNQLCSEMAKPDDFRFVHKNYGGNSNLASITFYYKTDKDPVVIKGFYLKWARENNWSVTSERSFSKGKQSIFLEFVRLPKSDVQISCDEPR